MKIENTAASSGTTALHDEEHMPAGYTVEFDQEDGTVATVRKEVGESLAEQYAAIEVVTDDAEDGDGDEPADDTDSDTDDDTSGSDN
jgi:hypothetical protein